MCDRLLGFWLLEVGPFLSNEIRRESVLSIFGCSFATSMVEFSGSNTGKYSDFQFQKAGYGKRFLHSAEPER